MDINVLAKWFPENWKSMNELQLYGHFNKFFCSDMRFVLERGNYFEQLLSSKVFGGQLRTDLRLTQKMHTVHVTILSLQIPYSESIASEFNEMTRRGQRNCMANEYFNIWFRSILKQIIKPERFILGTRVCDFQKDPICINNIIQLYLSLQKSGRCN